MESNECNFDWVYLIDNAVIQEAVPRTATEIYKHKNVSCSVSGGSDSDVLTDIVSRLDKDKKVKYVFFDTGIEMEATKRHIKYLEDKYGIQIETAKPKISAAAATRKFGYPFISKQVSEYIERLQRHGFDFKDGNVEELLKKYPGCSVAIKWWCNANGEKSRFNIERCKYLKEFMIQNPPQFKISNKCCKCAKKEPANTYRKQNKIDVTLIGIRKAEGGARASAYKNCINNGVHGLQHYPMFYFTDQDKQFYENICSIKHSDAYTVYGCTRTGCAGCPFGSNFEEELLMLERFEPKLARAVKNIFKPSYEYTRAYRTFKEEKSKLESTHKLNGASEMSGQLAFDDV